ncbi:MAG: hypothetical protein PHV60_09685 [bacterium]|nr:hypothetical protein [bacterium]
MKKIVLMALFVLIATATLAQAEEVGTYKLILGNRSEVYKINTKTGQSWVSTQIVISDVNQLTYYWGAMSPEEIKKWEVALKLNDGKAVIRIWQSLDDKALLPVQ